MKMGVQTRHCPCCGQTLTRRALPRVDLDANVLLYDNRAIHLPAGLAETLFVLFKHQPGVVSREQLLIGVYGFQDGPQSEAKIIDVYVHKLRALIRPAGLQINTHWGRGYSLALLAVEEAA